MNEEEFFPIPSSNLKKVLELIVNLNLVGAEIKGILSQNYRIKIKAYEREKEYFTHAGEYERKEEETGLCLAFQEKTYTIIPETGLYVWVGRMPKSNIEGILRHCQINHITNFEVNSKVWGIICETDLKPVKLEEFSNSSLDLEGLF